MSDIKNEKFCPVCGEANGNFQPLCSSCRADLTMVRPEFAQDDDLSNVINENFLDNVIQVDENTPFTTGGLNLQLVSDPEIVYSICHNQTIGRSNEADIVLNESTPELAYISRRHARFIQRKGQWYVVHEGTTNFISVDGIEHTDDAQIAIYENSVLVFSKTAFRTRIEGTK